MKLKSIALALITWVCLPGWADPIDLAAAQALQRLFDTSWQASAQRDPQWSTFRGDLRYNDKLSDVSASARQKDKARARSELAAVQAIDAERLSEADRLSRDMFIYEREQQIRLEAFEGYFLMGVGSMGGVQTDLSELLQVVPMNNVQQVEQLLTRLSAFPEKLDQDIANLRQAMRLGYVPARPILERALAQIDAQLPKNIEDGPFYAPFKRIGQDVPQPERLRLQSAGQRAVEAHVVPAMTRLRAFIAGDYRKQAPREGGMLNYPKGRDLYDELVRARTTTTLNADEVHAIGLRQLQRIHAAMDSIMREAKFAGDFRAFIAFLNSDARFFYKNPQDFLAAYREIARRIDLQLPRLFNELPKFPYQIRAMPAHFGPDKAEYYDPPSDDGSRPGYFNANVLGFNRRPSWTMASLTAHEAVPGHHLQIARAKEQGNLPEFRRAGGGYTAYVEGWALYAETLGQEIGLYADPYSHFGHLQWQALRAARLVVDTGLHAKGWTREQALAFMVEQTGMDPGFLASEVDRYMSDPAQALAYMIGQLKIVELRERANAKLGSRFDIRAFHNAVIDQGAMPLGTLEALVDRWIERQLALKTPDRG